VYKRTTTNFKCSEAIYSAVMLIVLAGGADGFSSVQGADNDYSHRLRGHDPEENHSWIIAGGNLENTHASYSEHNVSRHNVFTLTPKWTFTTGGDVSATPTVEDGALYVPDWGGNLYKIDAITGAAIWQHKMSEYTGIATSLARTSPAIARGMIVVGDQVSGTVLALDKYSGMLLWKTTVESHPAARITGSPIVYRDRVYVGVSSSEESRAVIPGYQFSFRGSIQALDLTTGEVVWTLYTVPPGYTGGAVWSTFAVDPVRHALYATTGNNYSTPDGISGCLQQATDVDGQLACLDPQDYVDSVLSLDLEDGRLNWARRFQGADTFIYTCAIAVVGGVPCPNPPGPDYDFGAGANLFSINQNGQPIDVVGAGQKSGTYWAMNADNGDLLWATQVGPGGLFGGIEWGVAIDEHRIYAAIGNLTHVSYTLAPAHTVTVNAGSWAALNPATGEILWQVPATGQDPRVPSLGGLGVGQLSAANGVVYAGSTSGDMVALDAKSGQTLWKFASGGSVVCGPSIVDGSIYWGSGYSRLGVGTANNKLYAFRTPSRMWRREGWE
jgi:polyvinyl alcohol dehydrogenase (cytochrome)